MRVTVLASGGLDSTVCLAYYRAREDDVQALWVDYGQPAARAEAAAVARIAAHYAVPLLELRVAGIPWQGTGEPREYPARNLTLAALALNTHPGPGLIALGIHAGSPFEDCTESFVAQLDSLVSLLSRGRVRVDCPFVAWSKFDVARWGWSAGVPFHLTYSCERGTTPPCQECLKCREVVEIASALCAR